MSSSIEGALFPVHTAQSLVQRIFSRIHHSAAKLIAVMKRTNTRSLYVTRKRSRLTSVQSSITGLYSVRHSPLLLLTLANIQYYRTV